MWYIHRFIKYVIIGTIRCLWWDLLAFIGKRQTTGFFATINLCYQDFVTSCSMHRRAKKQRKEAHNKRTTSRL